MNKKAKGEFSVAKILTRFLELGYQVAIPFGDNQRYDLVIVINEKAIRVQCKTGYSNKEGSFVFHATSCNPFSKTRKHYHNEADMFAVYYPLNNKIYYIPVKDVKAGTPIFRLDETKNNQSKNIRYARYYEI